MAERRPAAEWVTFAVACLVVLALAAIIASQVGVRDGPASPAARIEGPARPVDGLFQVPVEVENEGGDATEEVTVEIELVVEDETLTADKTIDFLPAGQTEHVVFVFDRDPASGELSVRVTGFRVP